MQKNSHGVLKDSRDMCFVGNELMNGYVTSTNNNSHRFLEKDSSHPHMAKKWCRKIAFDNVV
jgi:hypothetical protein